MSDQQPQRFFIPLPWEFFDAWLVDQRLRRTHVLTALYVAARCFEARNTSGGVAPIELSTVARLCDVGTEQIRRSLHDLREWRWVDFKPAAGSDSAWRIWLTGLSLETPSPPWLHHRSTTSPPNHPLRGGATAPPTAPPTEAANPLGERETSPPLAPTNATAVTPIRDETRRQEKKTENLSSKGRKENDVGKTTADGEPPCESEPEFPPLLDALEPDPFHENDRLLSDEEISELGTVSTGELHRRHERGEL